MTDLRFAILGTAKIARTVGPKIQSADGASVVGVASRNLSTAKAFAGDLGLSKSWGSYQQAIDDPEVDAVYIPLPPSLHLEWTSKAAAAGKHVLCEKPMSCSVEHTSRMIDVCRQHGVVLMDGVMWYHTPRAAAIRRIVDGAQLGELRQLTSVFTFRWDTMPMDNVRLNRDLGGGSLLDLGWYCVGVCLLLFQQLPQKVFATAQWCNDVDTRMNALLWFDQDRMATIECGFDTVRRRWMEVAGATGALVCDDFTRPWKPEKPRFWTHDTDGNSTEHVVPHKPQEECMVEAFCEFVRRGEVSHPWLQLSRQTQLVCDALDQSARTGTPVEL
ncbi:MAG: Gfo/Idh/MocA family oxidoreductase [Fuerstiella sp.]